jgi:hypothetical protein
VGRRRLFGRAEPITIIGGPHCGCPHHTSVGEETIVFLGLPGLYRLKRGTTTYQYVGYDWDRLDR